MAAGHAGRPGRAGAAAVVVTAIEAIQLTPIPAALNRSEHMPVQLFAAVVS